MSRVFAINKDQLQFLEDDLQPVIHGRSKPKITRLADGSAHITFDKSQEADQAIEYLRRAGKSRVDGRGVTSQAADQAMEDGETADYFGDGRFSTQEGLPFSP